MSVDNLSIWMLSYMYYEKMFSWNNYKPSLMKQSYDKDEDAQPILLMLPLDEFTSILHKRTLKSKIHCRIFIK